MNKLCFLSLVLLLLVPCLVACKSSPAFEPGTESALTLDAYNAAVEDSKDDSAALHEKTTIGCQLFGQTFQYVYEITQEGEGYIAKDAETGGVYSSDEFENADMFFLRFGRLPPVDSEQFLSYELQEQSVTAALPSEAFRERLLQASSLFAGIGANTDQITLGDCTYQAELDAEGRLAAYTYTVTTSLNTTGVGFTADVTLRVERHLS
ncbi:MAG: hypothetical protein HFE78_00505 [Clostridiales bacterium]|nr:hypothetical protein [Clostridiales bacterium]